MTGKHRAEDDDKPRKEHQPKHDHAGSDLPPRGKGVKDVDTSRNTTGRKGSKR